MANKVTRETNKHYILLALIAITTTFIVLGILCAQRPLSSRQFIIPTTTFAESFNVERKVGSNFIEYGLMDNRFVPLHIGLNMSKDLKNTISHPEIKTTFLIDNKDPLKNILQFTLPVTDNNNTSSVPKVVQGPSKVATRPSVQPKAASYFSLRNSSTFLADKTISTRLPTWEVRVWIEASPPANLSQIKYVMYHTTALPGGVRENLAPIRCCPSNKFLLAIGNVKGDFPLTATLYFKDGKPLEIGPLNLKLIIPRGYEAYAPVQLKLEPKMTSLVDVTINGTARPGKVGHITKVYVDWGDGEKKNYYKFPFLHRYLKLGPYTIKVTAYSSLGLSTSQTVQTQTLLLQRSFPKDLPIGVKGVIVLKASTSSSSISQGSSTSFKVLGTLFNYTNGVGIVNYPIDIMFRDNANKSVPFYPPKQIPVSANGNFNYSYPNLNLLPPGQYKVLVQVPNIRGLNATNNLVVSAPQIITAEQLNTGIVIIGGIIGAIAAIAKVPDYILTNRTRRKQANYLSMYMQQINRKYNEFNNDGNGLHNKRQYIENLEDIRDTITNLLQRRDISESQFKMLDDRISDYQQKISNTQ